MKIYYAYQSYFLLSISFYHIKLIICLCSHLYLLKTNIAFSNPLQNGAGVVQRLCKVYISCESYLLSHNVFHNEHLVDITWVSVRNLMLTECCGCYVVDICTCVMSHNDRSHCVLKVDYTVSS